VIIVPGTERASETHMAKGTKKLQDMNTAESREATREFDREFVAD